MKRMIPRKAIAAGVLILTAALRTADISAHPQRYRHSHHARIWVGHRIVVTQPVVIHPIIIDGHPCGVIDFNVQPETTTITVDGEYRGTVDEFDGFPEKMTLRAGKHKIVFEAPDGSRWSEKVRVVAGHEINIKLELKS